MNPRPHRSRRRRWPRRAAADICLGAALLLVAAASQLAHSHASASSAIYNEQHVLENPGARSGDVSLAQTSLPWIVPVLVAATSAPDDRVPSPASGRPCQSRAPPST